MARRSGEFHEKLLTFGHGGGFSVHGRHLVLNEEPAVIDRIVKHLAEHPRDDLFDARAPPAA